MTVGELIRAERKKKGWTQSELAERLGISYVALHNGKTAQEIQKSKRGSELR